MSDDQIASLSLELSLRISAKQVVERAAKVVLFQDGSKVMQLEGVDAATVTADELQEALEAPQ